MSSSAFPRRRSTLRKSRYRDVPISWPVERETGAPVRVTSSWTDTQDSHTSSGQSSDASEPSSFTSNAATASTAPTTALGSSPMTPPLSKEVETCSCNDESSVEMDIDAYFQQFRDDLDISDALPSQTTLEVAGEIPIFDADGQAMPFKNVYSGDTVLRERQLVVFVRHFYCGACQHYLRALTNAIPLSTYHTMPITTSITVIGCGSPALIPHYKRQTGCPYPIYTDPSRRLYKALGMSWTLDIGDKRPGYMKDVSPPVWLAGQIKQIIEIEPEEKTVLVVDEKGQREERERKRRLQRLRERWRLRLGGGNWVQVGGEFLFQDGEAVWCHRMRNYRGHAEMEVVKRVLEIEE